MSNGDITIRVADLHRVQEEMLEQIDALAEAAGGFNPGIILFPTDTGPIKIPPPRSGACLWDSHGHQPGHDHPITVGDLHRLLQEMAQTLRCMASTFSVLPPDQIIYPQPTDQPKPIPIPPPPRSHMCLVMEEQTTD